MVFPGAKTQGLPVTGSTTSGPPAEAVVARAASATAAARRNCRLAIRMAHPPVLDPLALDGLSHERREAASVHRSARRGHDPLLGVAEEPGVHLHAVEEPGVVRGVGCAR